MTQTQWEFYLSVFCIGGMLFGAFVLYVRGKVNPVPKHANVEPEIKQTGEEGWRIEVSQSMFEDFAKAPHATAPHDAEVARLRDGSGSRRGVSASEQREFGRLAREVGRNSDTWSKQESARRGDEFAMRTADAYGNVLRTEELRENLHDLIDLYRQDHNSDPGDEWSRYRGDDDDPSGGY